MQRVAVSWLVWELTHSALFVALSFSLPQVSFVLLGPFVGAVADKINRKFLIIGAQVMMCVGNAGLAVLVYTGSETTWLVILIAMGLGVAMSTYFLSVQAMVFDIVDRKDAMNGLSLWFVGMRAISAVGAIAGGFIIDWVGIWPAFMTASIVYVLAAGTMMLIRHRPKPRTGPTVSVLSDLKDGLRHILGSRELAALLVLTTIAEAFGWGTPSLLAIFASDRVFDVGPRGLGFLNAAFAIGGMVGAAGLAAVGDFRRKGAALAVALVMTAVALAAFSQVPWFALAMVLLIALGAVLAVYDTVNTVLIQGNVGEEMRGRALGAIQIAIGLGPVGPLLMGFAAGFVGVQTAVGMGAAIVLVGAMAVSMAAPGVRRMESG